MNLIAILLGKHRTGDVDEPAARLDQAPLLAPARRAAQHSRTASCLSVSRHLASGLRRQLPEPEQGASTSTQSILPASCSSLRAFIGADDLDIARSRPLQAFEDRPQPVLVGIVGVDLALVRHHRGKRQRLAAGARTDVGDLLAGFGARHQCSDLRTRVLNFEPALSVRGLGFDVRRCGHRGGADAIRTHQGDNGPAVAPIFRERRQHFRAVRFQEIDAKVDGCASSQGGALLGGAIAERTGERGRQPFGKVARDMDRRLIADSVCKRRLFAAR